MNDDNNQTKKCETIIIIYLAIYFTLAYYMHDKYHERRYIELKQEIIQEIKNGK